ncbi:peptidase M20 [Anaerobacillus alkalidiazotrophicus]|uniref:Peptidase M20 n=1 Tax=Anaerobacillus alkalidiazotrophicus TaxID=472963 RepID=A0A1S2MCL3_9BACI|nr:M20 family metallopeptidase [Anaerobacillus alkalidiazotrophicus]OIJ22326.1 peptidase M20 [Anaerobacillus alkalidiazotrophicus]
MVENVIRRLEDLFSEMVQLRRHFHQYPELSFKEVETAKTIFQYLTDLGIECKENVGGRGVVGIIHGGKPGKTVALRADFDALPIQEETNVEFKSQNPGVMHACGHDAHTATLLVLAKVLQENRTFLQGNIVLIFQFAEELAPGGAKPMIEDGCLEGVDAVFGTHIWSTMPIGEIGFCYGPIMAAADSFEVTIHGKGGHGAAPHETVDSIVVASTLITNFQQIVSRNVDPLKSAVVTVGSFHAGEAYNVISDTAKIKGTVRTFEPEVQDDIIEKLERYVSGICIASGADYEFKYRKGYPTVINHDSETASLVASAKQIMGEENVKQMAPVMGGEDFSYYLQHVPGTFFFTGAGNVDEGIVYPHHHPKFNIDERCMLVAARVLAQATVDYLEEGASATPDDTNIHSN